MISVASSLNVEVIEIQEVRVNSGNPQVASASKHPIDCDGLRKVLAQGTSVASALHVGVFEIKRGRTAGLICNSPFRSPVLLEASHCDGLRRCWRKGFPSPVF